MKRKTLQKLRAGEVEYPLKVEQKCHLAGLVDRTHLLELDSPPSSCCRHTVIFAGYLIIRKCLPIVFVSYLEASLCHEWVGGPVHP